MGEGSRRSREGAEGVPIAPLSLVGKGRKELRRRLGPGDIVKVPIGVYRGFRNLSDDPQSTLIAIVGGPDPGLVDWHPTVIEEARATGLEIDEQGRLIVGEKVCPPQGGKR